MDGHATDRTRPHLLTRRLATLTGALVLAAAGTALADAAPDIDAGHCQAIRFCVGVGVGGGTGPHGGQTAASGTGGGDSTVKCTLTKVDPKPPADHPAWNGADPKTSDLYFRACTDGGTANPDGFVVVGEGEDVPQVDPRELAQRAVDSMTLLGPDIASPRPAGRYTVGVPLWLWVNQSATTFGPNTASASAGGVTVTATAKVSKPRPRVRTYTIRRFAADASAFDIEVSLHEVDASGQASAPGTRWALAAEPGSKVTFLDEGHSYAPPAGAAWQVLVGDESALPAILAILEHSAADLPAQVFLEVPAPEDIRDHIQAPPGSIIHWLPRRDPSAKPGLPALDALTKADLPQGRFYTWTAGESSLATGVRRHLAGERGGSKSDISFRGYFSHGRASL